MLSEILVAAGIAGGGALIAGGGAVWWGVATQRKFVHLDELCRNALAQIGVQLESRWDGLSALLALTSSYATHESETLLAIVGQRKAISPTSQAKDIVEQESLIAQAETNLVALAETYPELKAHEVFLEAMAGARQYEDQVRMSRMVYNDTITKWNRLVRQFPSNLLASSLGAHPQVYLESAGEKRQLPGRA